MSARIMQSKSGQRYLLCEYDPLKRNWGEIVDEAARTLGDGVRLLPCICVRRGSALNCRIIDPEAATSKQSSLFDQSEV
jgi:hypothetical protein